MLTPRQETGDRRGFTGAGRRELRRPEEGRQPGIILARGIAAGQMRPDRRVGGSDSPSCGSIPGAFGFRAARGVESWMSPMLGRRCGVWICAGAEGRVKLPKSVSPPIGLEPIALRVAVAVRPPTVERSPSHRPAAAPEMVRPVPGVA